MYGFLKALPIRYTRGSMLQKIVHRLLRSRHYWRHATFSEVAELYISRMFRMLAINISATFMSVFLYQIGYSIQFIAGYWLCFYVYKVCAALPITSYIARVGPKHGILVANLLFIPAMLAFSLVPAWGLPVMAVIIVLHGTSAAMYNIAYSIDFSKVKNPEHAGKEMAYMNVFEKVATGLSPVIGGVLAYVAGPQATMWAAAILFSIAAAPLFYTPEPVASRRHISFRELPWRQTYRSILASSAVGFDIVASGTVWSLLVAVTIVGVTASNQVYAIVGGLSSVLILSALVSSYAYGKLIDKSQGGGLLHFAVLANSLVHAVRPFVHSLGAVGIVNVTNEAATTGYSMSFTRGLFDTADNSGYRMIYFGCVEVMLNVGAAFAAASLLLTVSLYGEDQGVRSFFFVAALAVLVAASANFRLYRK